MAEQREVFKVDFDVSDVERKLARVRELMEQISAGRAAGGDVTRFERELEVEFQSMGKLGQATRDTGGATGDLIKQKEKLASVVGLLGGRFGGTIGQLGNMVELLLLGGGAAAGFAGVLAGATGLIVAMSSLKEKTEEANRALSEYESRMQGVLGQTVPAEALSKGLMKHGALGAGSDRATAELYLEMLGSGVPSEMALPIAPLAHIAGAGAADAAAVAWAAQAAGKGPTSPAEFSQALQDLAPHRATIDANLGAMRGSLLGRNAMYEAAQAKLIMERRPDLWALAIDPNAQSYVVDYAKKTGLAGVENFEDLDTALAELAGLRIKGEAAQAFAEGRPHPGIVRSGRGSPYVPRLSGAERKRMDLLGELEAALERFGGPGEATGGAPTIIINQDVQQWGTVFNASADPRRTGYKSAGGAMTTQRLSAIQNAKTASVRPY